jgi:hypothetical protein
MEQKCEYNGTKWEYTMDWRGIHTGTDMA